MAGIFFCVTALSLFIIATPVFIAMLAPTFLTMEFFGPAIPAAAIVSRMVAGINKFSLLAIPLFIFSADIIARGEIGVRLLKMVESMIGHITGGVAITTAVACALFGAISGIGAAAVVTIGPIVYPTLLRQGYSRGFAVGLILCSSTLAMLIPPSVAVIIYSLQTMSSVGAVFLSGLSAGVVFTALIAAYSYYYARKNNIGRQDRASTRERITSIKRSFWAVGLPVIIFGGIYSGAFTPTEAAGTACIYAIIVESLIYRKLPLRDILKVSADSAMVISTLMILITAGSVVTYYLTLNQVPQMISDMLGGHSRLVILLIINLIFLVAGMLIDPSSAIIVLSPLIFPAAMAAGIDPIHLGAVIVMNVAIGMITPPFGMNIFLGIVTFKVPYYEIVRHSMPFIAVAILGLLLVTYIPGLVTWLPHAVGY